jgi:hypothetical protein
MDDTWPLILVPIVTGFTGVSLILFTTAWFGGAKRWARKLHIVRSGQSSQIEAKEQTGQLQFPYRLYFDYLDRFWNVYPNHQSCQWYPFPIQ